MIDGSDRRSCSSRLSAIAQPRIAATDTRTLSKSAGGIRMGRSTPASMYAARRSLQRLSGPMRQTASRNRSLDESGPPPGFGRNGFLLKSADPR